VLDPITRSFALARPSWTGSKSSAKIGGAPRDHRRPIHTELGLGRAVRVLFSEASSLTAREFASVLGPAGHHIEVMDPDPGCLLRW